MVSHTSVCRWTIDCWGQWMPFTWLQSSRTVLTSWPFWGGSCQHHLSSAQMLLRWVPFIEELLLCLHSFWNVFFSCTLLYSLLDLIEEFSVVPADPHIISHVIGLVVCNWLPFSVHHVQSLLSFKYQLKSHLFSIYTHTGMHTHTYAHTYSHI